MAAELHGPDDAAFPPESDWLSLEPPPIGEDFVGRTLARLVDLGLVNGEDTLVPRVDGEDGGDVELPPGLLQRLEPPPATADFVARTLQRVQRERADDWRRLLLRYDAPEPTPDFVARTLAALRPATPAAVRRGRLLLFALATAAAAALLFLLRPAPPAAALRALIASTQPTTAAAHSPAVLSHLLASASEDSALSMQPADGPSLWLAMAEERR